MGWSIGFDSAWQRDIGYGVPATCDHPDCKAIIDRGLGCVCGGQPYGGDKGCGLYFCGKHLYGANSLCDRCFHHRTKPFKPKPDRSRWLRHKLSHSSWKQWREENPREVTKMWKRLEKERRMRPKKP